MVLSITCLYRPQLAEESLCRFYSIFTFFITCSIYRENCSSRLPPTVFKSPILSVDKKHESNDYLPLTSYIYGCKDYDTLEHKYMFKFSKWHP